MKIVKQLAHVCIFTDDVEKKARFYKDVLGIEIKFTFMRKGDYFGFYLDTGGRTNIEVFRKTEAKFAETDQINHMCLEVENMDEAIAHIRGQGVEVTDKKHGADHTFQAWLKDPDGVKIELFEYTDKSLQFTGGVCEADW